tara:strand:+ start:7587 stop:8486 length:900 start_codon:yes stop_codon:yes gene_type:complete
MKFNFTTFVLTSFLFVSSSCDNKITNPTNDIYLSIPDSHFETILIEQGIDSDGVVNQKILKEDAEKVSQLDLNKTSNFGEISNLTGIEGFINIKLLSAALHKIEAVDLSFNTKLDTLFLQGNYLTSIDISNNQNLVFADVQSNELSSIKGLSKATRLKKLNVSWNNLKEFSIQNESIEVLHISQNLLKSFDTSGAINLTNILLTSNELITVDLSSNTLLETLLISDNRIQNISLEHNRNLTHLYITSNSLTNLNVSNNKELVDLRVDRNPDLTCIEIKNGQEIPTVSLSDYQELNNVCN